MEHTQLTDRWHRLLAATMQHNMSPALAALHKVNTGNLCAISCTTCGYALTSTRKAKRRIERTCRMCGSVSIVHIPTPKGKVNFLKAGCEDAARTEQSVAIETRKRHEHPAKPTATPAPKSSSSATALKRQKKAGLEKLLAQSRARQADAVTASTNFFAL